MLLVDLVQIVLELSDLRTQSRRTVPLLVDMDIHYRLGKTLREVACGLQLSGFAVPDPVALWRLFRISFTIVFLTTLNWLLRMELFFCHLAYDVAYATL